MNTGKNAKSTEVNSGAGVKEPDRPANDKTESTVNVEQAKVRMRKSFIMILIAAFLIGGVGAVALWQSDQGGLRAPGTEEENSVPTEKDTGKEETADITPPVIEGVADLTVPAGGSISYKRGVSVKDDRDENVQLIVDNSGVDLNTVGDYEVIYKAVDAAGNETVVTAIVHVTTPSAENATEEMVNTKAKEVLAEITTADMGQMEVAEAIFWWCHENIAYMDGSPKGSWVQGAYAGLFDRKGDCYTYFATAKCLLTQAGIKNMDIKKVPEGTPHYWNLIDVGEGWHHFDATRRKDGNSFFYTPDAELMEYSAANADSHLYDPSQYPEIQ